MIPNALTPTELAELWALTATGATQALKHKACATESREYVPSLYRTWAEKKKQ